MITAMLAVSFISLSAFTQQLPDDVNNAFTRGLTLGSQGQHEEALSAFREAVRLKPDFAEGHRSIGVALASLGRYEEARIAYQEAVRLKPDFAEAYINIATVLAHQSRYAEGLRAYQEAVRLKPDLAKTYFDLEEALKTQETKRITDPTRRLQFESFSVLPPSGENWFIQKQATDNVHFSKGTTRGEYHTVTAFARSSDTEFASWANRLVLAREGLLTEQLLSLGAKIQEQQWQDSRYKPLEARYALDSSLGKECVRFDFTVEDRGVPYAPGSVFVLTVHDFYCLHPDSSNLVVYIAYSQRFLQGEQALPIESEVEPFLRSLEFTPIQFAARELEPPIADANAQDPDSQLLFEAIMYGQTGKVQDLLEAGADVNAKHTDSRHVTVLMAAASKGYTATVQKLLDRGAKVDATDSVGATALMWAAYLGHTETVQLLLNAGAKVNAKAEGGGTALSDAAEKGYTSTVVALLDARADVNARNNEGFTPLMQAAGMGHADIVEILLAKGAKVNAKTKDGVTPLISAVLFGRTHTVRILLEADADTNLKHKNGATALMLAEDFGHTEIVELLKAAGAKE
jgi:ankyrin repeat protein